MDAGFLSNKVILILSPQSWGKMLLAKHHYAIELASRGNEVYFLNPPDNDHWSWKRATQRISVLKSADHSNLFLIDQQLFFPYKIIFHARRLYNFFIRKQIADILRVIGKPVDVIWSFDLGNLFPLRYFNPSVYKVFHPLDEPRTPEAIRASAGADVLFSVTGEILARYKYPLSRHLINHGISDEFIKEQPDHRNGDRIQVGFSGNLLRRDIDRDTLLSIIRDNQELDFNFFGSYEIGQSNIGAGMDNRTAGFIKDLKILANVKLHGVLDSAALAAALNEMQVLLICYDIEKDQSRGTNYHKVMEYISTGKVIVSNNITAYAGEPALVRMVAERNNNKNLGTLFLDTVRNLDTHNSPELFHYRVNFARNNTYKRQLDRIEELIRQTRKPS
ncbi:MAG TPA: hypothetical protein VGM24_12665 [Puia sp.]|jgi:hypothetical protein